MGSFGCWVECYWCGYWVYDPYILDWIGAPLCDWCYEWELEDEAGGPYEPSARTRWDMLLLQLRPLAEPGQKQELLNGLLLCEPVRAQICEFLCEWHEP